MLVWVTHGIYDHSIERLSVLAVYKNKMSWRPDATEISLQLPYDYLKTSNTRFERAHLPGSSFEGQAVEENEDCVLIISACIALFYRYSDQSVIPISIEMEGSDSVIRAANLKMQVAGTLSLASLRRAVADKLSHAENPVDRHAQVFVSIRHHGARNWREKRIDCGDACFADMHLKFDVGLNAIEYALDYNAALFEQSTVERLLRHLHVMFLAALNGIPSTISSIALFSVEENEWFNEHCQGESVEYPNYPISAEFESHAANNPNKDAVRFKNESLSYEELNQRANQFARFLRSRGITTESRVVVCIDPSLDIAITLLAILKAGATYIPLNPAYPAFRISMIVEDTDAELIVTQTHLAHLVSGEAVELIVLDDLPEEIGEQSVENLDLEIDSDHNAYIFYTSGTTGKPKGVMATHSNLSHFIRASRERYGITSEEVMPAVASYTFSISMFELMSPLSVGGTLVVLERSHVLDVGRMATLLQNVTMFHIGPALLKGIVQYIKQNIPDYSVYKNVRHASSGGDMIPPELLRDMQQIFTSSEIFVIYGCSEISLMGCTWEIPLEAVTKTYVGKPFSNVLLRVVDNAGNQVPIGAVGDVCFGGKGVVPGYLNRPELIAELFFESDGVRYYRTGDRAKLCRAGNLELLGRRDFQIQLRGMRVEIGEIEYHLRQAEGVRDGLVAADKHSGGENVLVAYYVVENKQDIDIAALRTHMVERLPDYMVPSFYVRLDALPLNYNMKVDRNALPVYVPAESHQRNLPETAVQKSLARIWCDLLRVDAVSLEQNFMMLGGDSLLAMAMILKIQKEFGIKLDGMDILRESLFVLAKIVGAHSGRELIESQNHAMAGANAIHPVDSFYFGAEDSLYGLYNPSLLPLGKTPVLICPPIGYEYARCHFFLRVLAENLAAVGVPSLHFDFYGWGDSHGQVVDASLERWREDLLAARHELRARSGSQKIRVFGVRLTTILTLQALKDLNVERWVFWDPIASGVDHYQELARMNRETIHKLLVIRNLKTPQKTGDSEELLGTRFSTAVIDELKATVLRRTDIPRNAEIIQILSGDNRDIARGEVLDSIPAKTVADHCHWYRSTRVTTAITHQSLLKEFLATLQG